MPDLYYVSVCKKYGKVIPMLISVVLTTTYVGVLRFIYFTDNKGYVCHLSV